MIHFDKLRRHRSATVVPYTFVVLLCLLLSSCGLVPNATNSQPTQQQVMASVQPASFKTTKGDTAWPPPPEIQTFNSWVPDQTLAVVDKLPGGNHFKLKLVVAKSQSAKPDKELDELEADEADDDEDKDDAEEGDAEDDAFSVQAQKSNSKYTKKDRVFIPETGAFNLTFQAGSDYQVLDGDARDGNATVQMPREVLAAYMKVRGKFSRDAHKQFPAVTRKLSYADPLYYVKQDLTREKKRHGKQTWLSLGNRALPIPTDWRSADGDKYILKLNNQGVTRVVMRWYPTKGQAQATFPPGLKTIGVSGGEVALPGVARLVFPPGSLSQSTTVKVSQVLQVPSRHVVCLNPADPTDCHYGYAFTSAVVKVEPFGLLLNQPAKLYLTLDMTIAGRVPPYAIERFGTESPTLDPNSWSWGNLETYFRYFQPLNKPHIEDLRYDDEILLRKFVYVSKQVSYVPTSTNRSSRQNFSLAQVPSPIAKGMKSPHFLILSYAEQLSDAELKKAACHLERIYLYYSSVSPPDRFETEFNCQVLDTNGLNMATPKAWYPKEVVDKRIPVELWPDLPDSSAPGDEQLETQDTDSNVVLGSRLRLRACDILNNCEFSSPSRIGTIVHEVFHAFQFAERKSPDIYASDLWLIEGSALYMEHAVVSSHLDTFELTDFDYRDYLDGHEEGQLNPTVSFYNRVNRTPTKYTTVGFFSFIHNKHGQAQAIANIINKFENMPAYDSSSWVSGKAVNESFTSPLNLSNVYEDYAKAALLKTDVTLFPNKPIPLNPLTQVPTHKLDVPQESYTLKSSHIASFPLEISITLSSLSAKYLRIVPDATLPESAISIRLKELTPAKINNLPSETFFRPNIITLNSNLEPSQATLSAFQSVVSSQNQTVTIPNFGSQSPTAGVTIVIPNTLWQLKRDDSITGTMEIYYTPTLKLIPHVPASFHSSDLIDLYGSGFISQNPAHYVIVFTTATGQVAVQPQSIGEYETIDSIPQQKIKVTVPADAVTGPVFARKVDGCTDADFHTPQIVSGPTETCPVSNSLDLTITPAQQLILLDPNPFTLFTDGNILIKGYGMDTVTPSNNKVILTHSLRPEEVWELIAVGPIGTDETGANFMASGFPRPHNEISTGIFKAKLQLCRGTACTTSNEVDFNVRSPDIPSVKPKVDPPTTALRQGREVRITGEGFYPPATVKLTHTNGSVTTLSATGTLGELNFTPAYTLPTGTYTLKVCTAYQCSDAITVTIAPWRAQVSLVDSAPVLFANGIQTATLSFKVSGLPPNTSKSFIIKMLGNRKGNFYCESCGFYVHPTSNITVTKPNGSFNLRYLVPTANIEPFDYLGPAGQEWRDPRHYDQIQIESSDSLGSPYVAFPEPDSDIEQARIYWVYTYGGTLQIPTYVPANGQPNTFTIHNVTDRLGRPVPDGTTVYIANPYWGHFVNQAGGNATAYAVNGGSAQVIYSNTQIGGWGYVPTGEHASEGLHLRATLGTTYGTNDSRSWLYPQVEYRFFTYNLP